VPEIDGSKLRELRIRKGLSLEALAVRSGMSERAIRDLETGVTTQPRPTTVGWLATALEVGPEELWLREPAADTGVERRPEAIVVVRDVSGEVMSRRTLYSRLIMVGRDADRNDVPLPHQQVSLVHARIDVRVDALEVRDLGTANGTFVNGERIQGSLSVPFGTPIGIEPYTIEVHRSSGDATPPAQTLRLRRS
jgi:transcriptional regulator with XRE-family HTH domain